MFKDRALPPKSHSLRQFMAHKKTVNRDRLPREHSEIGALIKYGLTEPRLTRVNRALGPNGVRDSMSRFFVSP